MSSIASSQWEQLVGCFKRVLVGLAATGLLAGCSGAAASQSPSSVVPSPSGGASTAASTVPSGTPSSMPSIGAAPTGEWTGIRWTAAGPAFPQTPAAGTDVSVTVSLYGWSRGYVGFRAAIDHVAPGGDTVVSTSSADGLHWTAGRPMNLGGLEPEVDVDQVVEGPSGLLALGRQVRTQVCAREPATIHVLWTSTDGLTWSLVQPSADFAPANVYWVGGGSTGFIASGTLKDGKTQAVWLSKDGLTWTQAPLASNVAGKSTVNAASRFANGYIISGVTGLQCSEKPATPSVWWSADATIWTQSPLPSAATSSLASTSLIKISDHALVAVGCENGFVSQQVWLTNDGRTWKLVAAPSSLLASALYPGGVILTDGRRGLVVGESEDGSVTLATVGDDLAVRVLSQTGDVPIYSASSQSTMWLAALGPTGVVLLSLDGLAVWVGFPTAA